MARYLLSTLGLLGWSGDQFHRYKGAKEAGCVPDREKVRVKEGSVCGEIIATMRKFLVVLDSDLKVIAASRSFYTTFEVTMAETENKLLYELGEKQWNILALRKLLDQVLCKDKAFDDLVIERRFPGVGRKKMLLNAHKVMKGYQDAENILLAIEDISGT